MSSWLALSSTTGIVIVPSDPVLFMNPGKDPIKAFSFLMRHSLSLTGIESKFALWSSGVTWFGFEMLKTLAAEYANRYHDGVNLPGQDLHRSEMQIGKHVFVLNRKKYSTGVFVESSPFSQGDLFIGHARSRRLQDQIDLPHSTDAKWIKVGNCHCWKLFIPFQVQAMGNTSGRVYSFETVTNSD